MEGFVSDDDLETFAKAVKAKIGKGGDKNYVHNQSAPAKVWEITHNLGKIPSITVIDSFDRVVIGDVMYDSENPLNKLTIEFSGSFSGKATLN